MIGDKISDVECGKNAKCKNSFLIDNNSLYDIVKELFK
jgi:histidinol phosphatase-like enzyme